MATRHSTAKPALDDDWEEVADNYSVVSLPNSDDEQDDAPNASSSSPPLEPPPVYTDDRASLPPDGQSARPQIGRTKDPQTRLFDALYTTVPSDVEIGPQSIPRTSSSPSKLPSNSFQPYSPPTTHLSQGFRDASPIGEADARGIVEPVYFSNNCRATEAIRTPIYHPTPSRPSANTIEATNQHSRILDLLGAPLRRQQFTTPAGLSFGHTTKEGETSASKPWVSRDVEQTTRDIGGLTLGASPNADAESSNKREETLGETLDLSESSTDPVSISRTLESLGDYVVETFNRTRRELAGFDQAVVVSNNCQALMVQVNELLPILAEYATQWEKPMGDARDIPLDPSLTLWMSSLRSILSKLRKKSKLWCLHPSGAEERKVRSSLAKLATALSDHTRQMDDFLPIIQVDFNDYRTKNMTFPTEEIDDVGSGPSRGGNIPRPTNNLSRVRKAMYALKDQIEQTVHVLATSQAFLPQSASDTVSDVVRSLGSTFNAASLALTNNGSEWIESDLGRAQMGLLSHAEFSSLDPTTLDDLTLRLKQISDLVSSDPADRWTEDMIRRHYVCMLVDQNQLDALGNIASVLEEMMVPNHMKTRTEFEDFLKEM